MTLPALPTTFAEFDALPLPGAAIEDDGTVIAINPLGARLLGWPIRAIVGRKAWEFAPGMEYVWAERLAVSRAACGAKFEFAILTQDGARAIEYILAMVELDGRRCVLALAVAVKPLV